MIFNNLLAFDLVKILNKINPIKEKLNEKRTKNLHYLSSVY